MRRLDFISKAPNFSIFKEGANKTNLGGFLFFIYIIIILLLALVYFFDYIKNDKYLISYTLVRKDYGDKWYENDPDKGNMLFTNLKYFICLGKDSPRMEKNISNNNNFIIVDMNKLPPGNNYTYLNSTNASNNDDKIIKQGKTFTSNVDELQLGVLYRCNRNDCNIRDEDKIQISSYYLFLAYNGYTIEHQDPKKPLQPLEENYYFVENIQFLNNT